MKCKSDAPNADQSKQKGLLGSDLSQELRSMKLNECSQVGSDEEESPSNVYYTVILLELSNDEYHCVHYEGSD